jgi:predicted nuclease with TOPRIM domain
MADIDILERLDQLQTYLDSERSRNDDLQKKYDKALTDYQDLEDMTIELEKEKGMLAQEVEKLRGTQTDVAVKVDAMLEKMEHLHLNPLNEGQAEEADEAAAANEEHQEDGSTVVHNEGEEDQTS